MFQPLCSGVSGPSGGRGALFFLSIFCCAKIGCVVLLNTLIIIMKKKYYVGSDNSDRVMLAKFRR